MPVCATITYCTKAATNRNTEKEEHAQREQRTHEQRQLYILNDKKRIPAAVQLVVLSRSSLHFPMNLLVFTAAATASMRDKPIPYRALPSFVISRIFLLGCPHKPLQRFEASAINLRNYRENK